MASKFFPWDEKYSVNSEVIDTQHKKLFDIANELYDAFTKGEHKKIIGEIIERLEAYTKYHFDEEDKIVMAAGGRLTPDHLFEHETFVQKISDVRLRYEKVQSSVTFGLMSFVRSWLTDHILKTDHEYKDVFLKQR